MSEPSTAWIERQEIISAQLRETVEQSEAGVDCRLMVITCPCGRCRGSLLMYKCLYCKIHFCDACAEEHFGKTVAAYWLEKGRKQ